MKNIILAEDHHVVRRGLKMLLESTKEYKVVFDAANGQEVLDAIHSGLKADLIISDICMPIMDGISLSKAIKQYEFPIPVMILSMFEDNNHLYPAIRAGAQGFLPKTVDADELFFALSRMIRGERYICLSLAAKIVESVVDAAFTLVHNAPQTEFSSREIEILKLIGTGMTNAEMADKLFISRRTVEGHRQNLIDKTGAKNTAVLMRFAYINGFLN